MGFPGLIQTHESPSIIIVKHQLTVLQFKKHSVIFDMPVEFIYMYTTYLMSYGLYFQLLNASPSVPSKNPQ